MSKLDNYLNKEEQQLMNSTSKTKVVPLSSSSPSSTSLKSALALDGSNRKLSFQFTGEGSGMFKVILLNILFTILTLGIYYPWAKANFRRYKFSHIALDGIPMQYHGTGKEMLKGFLLLVAIFIGIQTLSVLVETSIAYSAVFRILLLVSIGLIYLAIPFVIHSSNRYHFSRLSWRNIRFGYDGNLKEFTKLCYKGFFLTVCTLGIYSAWFHVDVLRYLYGHRKYGNLTFNFEGKGNDYFVINLKGYLLSLVTLGIYIPFWMKELITYHIENLELLDEKGERVMDFEPQIPTGAYIRLLLSNYFLLCITLGIATPWIIVRTHRFYISCIKVSSQVDFNTIVQTQEIYKDGTAESLADGLDTGFDLDLGL